MKHLILTAALLFLIPVFIFSQNIIVSFAPETENFDPGTYSTQNSELTVNNSDYHFGEAQVSSPVSWHISSAQNKLSFVNIQNGVNITLYNDNGNSIYRKKLPYFNSDDETIKNHQFNDGRVVLRDNVANFNFLNPKGEVLYSVSNSSQSSEGERESELASDYSGNTVVLYNPVISYGTSTGSRAVLVYGENETQLFFNDREREISYLSVNNSGAFVTVIASGRENDVVLVYDRFGNKIFETESGNQLIGAEITDDANYLTLYSSGRVQVVDIVKGEVLGSASSRTSIIKAAYMPEQNLILALGGSKNGNRITDPEITAVDLDKRQISRENISTSTLTFYDTGRITFSKESDTQIKLSGLNRDLIIRLN